MYKVVRKQRLADVVTLLEIESPVLAKKAKAGQFVIVRLNETAERIPLTLANWDAKAGTITIIFQHAGRSTHELAAIEVGDEVRDVVGPLGIATEVEKYGTVVCVGGGIGVAVLKPIAKAMKEAGNNVISIVGARDKSLIILEDEMRDASTELHVTTDNGSYGRKGFVSDVLTDLIKGGTKIDLIFAIGPVPMMKVVAELTRPHELKTMVSLDSIMIDGTGMCGGCRVTIGGETKFTCVDGPDFDGHLVDWSELVMRKKMYVEHEKCQLDRYKDECAGGSRK